MSAAWHSLSASTLASSSLVGGAATGLADVEQRLQLGDVAVALGQESRVLDGHRGLVGEHAEQAQLVIGEAGEAQPGEHDDADDATLRAEWRQQHRLLGRSSEPGTSTARGSASASGTLRGWPVTATQPVMPSPTVTRRPATVSPWYSRACGRKATGSSVRPSSRRT